MPGPSPLLRILVGEVSYALTMGQSAVPSVAQGLALELREPNLSSEAHEVFAAL